MMREYNGVSARKTVPISERSYFALKLERNLQNYSIFAMLGGTLYGTIYGLSVAN